MNPVNPKKLLHSKWTALQPANKEMHFLVSDVERDDDGAIIHCEIEAIMTRRTFQIDWRELRNSDRWACGWV
jgi:tryptophan-rich hypothetical protein